MGRWGGPEAHHRGFDGLSLAEEGEWQGDFCFVQLADPQRGSAVEPSFWRFSRCFALISGLEVALAASRLGMLHGDKSWEEEKAMLSGALSFKMP